MKTNIHLGDCLSVMRSMPDNSVDLIYLDPPFFTQKQQKLRTRDRTREFSFDDTWGSISQYAEFLHTRIREMRRLLKSTGSIFFHCDKTASHIARLVLDDIFSSSHFRSEIIWHYRRWSNTARNLLPAHQTLLFYTKTKDYKFNQIMTEYSASTNIDQILQKRCRDTHNKSIYERDSRGEIVFNGGKKGVPLSDVWEIPFLNPKAKERTGYPTQKPVLLLERIIQLCTDLGDVVLDPFCGSGTTLVAAKLLQRNYMGIDSSSDAIALTTKRLDTPMKSRSTLLELGRQSYETASDYAFSFLKNVDCVPVHRNSGIDAILRQTYRGGPVPVRVQRPQETVHQAASALWKSAKTKQANLMIVISTGDQPDLGFSLQFPPGLVVVESVPYAIDKILSEEHTSFEENAILQQAPCTQTARSRADNNQ